MHTNWNEALEPLLTKFGKKKHPLDYNNRYQLLIMVILSAQDSDKHINEVTKPFFEAYPTMSLLAKASPIDLHRYFAKVRNFNNKSKWLIELSTQIGEDDKIPTKLEDLIKLPGIGRKSANVIIRESDGIAEGVIVDLHVIRVAPRLGIAVGDKPEKIEKQLMQIVLKSRWNELGMAISFLGREICRPSNPLCDICMMQKVCKYYSEVVNKK